MTTVKSQGWELGKAAGADKENTRGRPGWRTGRRWLRGWELAAVVNRRKTTGEMSEQ